ncbi:hypothetical protein F4779DRAFT_604100 [Xylariaceae sp. FL0662B]|nr:hypothetical protein F4779DRAFT_604100 [Xylariaceae sp. FL0662B]
MASQYRIYIRFGDLHCVRFSAIGNGITAEDGLELFEWIRNPANIARLKKGLEYVYEVDEEKLGLFLVWAMKEKKLDVGEEMEYWGDAEEMGKAYQREHETFTTKLRTGVQKLEAIASAESIMTIPKTAPRKISDAPGWIYLLNLDQNTLEMYGFKYRSHRKLTINTLVRRSPNEPPGYYIKFSLPELQGMWRDDWVRRHQSHALALKELWKQNKGVLRAVPYAQDLPFSVLYGGVFHGKTRGLDGRRRSSRLTKAKLVEASSIAITRRWSNIYGRKMPSRTETTQQEMIRYFEWLNDRHSSHS